MNASRTALSAGERNRIGTSGAPGMSTRPAPATIERRVARERHAGDDEAPGGRAPVGLREHACDHARHEDRAERRQDGLDAVERAAQDERRDDEGGEREG